MSPGIYRCTKLPPTSKVDPHIHKSQVNSCYSSSKHSASTKQCQLTWFRAISLTCLQVFHTVATSPVSFTSTSLVFLFYIVLVHSMAKESFLSVWPVPFHFCSLIRAASALGHSSTVDLHTAVHIFLKRFTSVMTVLCDVYTFFLESYFTMLSVAHHIILNDSWIGEDLERLMA